MCSKPHDVTDEDMNLLREEDYTEEEILELVSQADVGIMFNIITMNAGIPWMKNIVDISRQTLTEPISDS